MDRTHSIMRIATTASPVSGAEVRTRMIHIAMQRDLASILLQREPPLTISGLFPDGADQDADGRPQMILAGSIVVQAALGCTWPRLLRCQRQTPLLCYVLSVRSEVIQ